MKKYKIGYTCGVFDMFHVGHLNLLEKCKSMCDYLIVGVCNDEYVRNIKHKEPVYSEQDRVRILEALKVVDRAELVTIEETNDKILAIEKFHFDVLFSGDDWKGSERYQKTEEQFKKYGAFIEYFPYTQGISTTQIKEKIKK
ncbi:adenylyltransferase/cytidyltransferase family protein [uncultured Ruminococcus sp.]|uniref:adenylyltransferase/cytidyltransferase family protein n=1 Tax=uncultured Ruminococcus sp. TaxID=165186 RepID=UPI00266DBFB7|nr:adenylyltransferase/cytidyltransferase family protein [uncultured Ruminococcus sp.]